jgi:hypothetical protein
MSELARKRNVFARHSYENSFYLERIGQLGGATVIEVFAAGGLDEVLPKVRRKAELLERIALVSSVFGVRRERTHQLLSINAHRRYGFDLAISPGFEYLRSSARRDADPRGIPITASFVRRFGRCGFPVLFEVLVSDTAIAKRLAQGLTWLFESRIEPSVRAAVVKSAIALESLLIANDSESLRGPLSERAAFILSDVAATRRRIGKAVKSFYDLRSAVVHGGGRRHPQVSPVEALEGIDRVVVLLMLTLAANVKTWATYDAVVEAVEERKWGTPALPLVRPFPGSHLTRAIQLLESASRRKAT